MELSNTVPPPASKPKREKPKSRSARWSDACGDALKALEAVEAALGEFEAACGELRSVQEEYEEWKDNMDDKFSGSPMMEKLEAVCDLEIEGLHEELQSAIDEARGKVEEAEGADLPMGFGRD